MSTRLDKLVKATPREDFKNMEKVFGDLPLDPELYTVNPSTSENNRIIQLREVIDKRKMEYIVSHPDNFELGSRCTIGVKLEKNAQLTLMKDYLLRVNKLGECVVRYYQRHKFGRYWTSEKLGIQNMSRKIRHIVCSGIMYDIDMKNAHPILLSWYCHDNGITCDGLDDFIENREQYMANWMARTNERRDEVKAHFLAIINGRRVKLTPDDLKLSIFKLRPELYALAKQSKDNRGTHYNIDGTTINYVMCSLENKALMIAFDYPTEQEIKVESLVFDGLVI
ncbi:unnamed protein product [Mytilus coruscus]|uniref:Uncharacterized protein n=1 Tax=Mytilus coruscus TaxID=42192 RepID=A0A6J8DDM7_MYTCO|nr:unnamed protein product [Mytilus coruscus]